MPAQIGSNNNASKITDADVLRILSMRNDGMTLHQIASAIGNITYSTVHLILAGKMWSHVTGIQYVRKRRPRLYNCQQLELATA